MYYLEYKIYYSDTDIDNYPTTETLVEEVLCDPKDGPGRTRQEVIDIILRDVLENHGTKQLADLFHLTHPSYCYYKDMTLHIENRLCDEPITEEDIKAQPVYKKAVKELKDLYKSQRREKKRRTEKYALIRDNEVLSKILIRFKSIKEIEEQIEYNINKLKVLEA